MSVRFQFFMRKKYLQFVDTFIPDFHQSESESFLKARLLINSCFTVLLFAVVYDLFYLLIGLWERFVACTLTALMAAFLLFRFKRKGNFSFSGHFYSACALGLLSFMALWMHGINSPIIAWMVIVPLSAFFFAGIRAGLIWTGISFLAILGLYFYWMEGLAWIQPIADEQMPVINIFLALGLLGYLVFAITSFQQGKGLVISKLRQTNTRITESSDQLKQSQKEIEGRNIEIEKQKSLLETQNQEMAALNADLEKVIAARTRHLETANEELDTFLYNSSHALRRPLARIMGLLDILKNEEDPQEIDFFRDKIDYMARNMDDMLYKLTQVTEVNHQSLNVVPVDLNELVNEIGESYSRELEAKKIGLVLENPENIRLSTDPYLLRLVLSNLLSNATQFSNPTQTKPLIRVSMHSAEDRVMIRVWDNGMGIPPEVLPNLFEMFFRGTEKSKGSGLGLYIVKKALDRMGGSIWVQSEPESFSVFILSLPRKLTPSSTDLPASRDQEIKSGRK